VFPRAEFREDRRVTAVNAETSRAEHVGDLSFMNKNCCLRFAHDQLCPVLDLLIANWKAIKHRVARIVEPLNDLNELCARAEPVKNSHLLSISFVRPLRTSSQAGRYYTVKARAMFNRDDE